ncbi:unnamed protein product [Ceutorhynchus assimilis]|uniref:Sensory neuron membrane protein 1 n=1 Tax=Ceutorhynchus assimilis TaxID=467358 RepID=A0A9P0GM62_9CUCU|nr:unnamed protein product [Ceutorhynchus assimilis]
MKKIHCLDVLKSFIVWLKSLDGDERFLLHEFHSFKYVFLEIIIMKTPEKLIYASLVILLVSILLKVWLFGSVVRYGIKDQTALKKRNEVRQIYLKIPFPLDFKIYLFNVTNPEAVQNGAKPILKEIGPYWYDEFKEKIDVVDNDTEDSLTYTPYDIYKFNQTKSGDLKEDDYVTIIHPVLVGMVSRVLRDSPVFLSIVNQSLAYIFNNPKSIFLTGKVKDILFDGIELNCTSKEFPPTAICSQMKTQVPGIKFKKGNDNVFLFSLLGPRNGTIPKRMKIQRGIKHYQDLGRLIEVDGQREIDLWSSDECNRFEGTDGWIFPPLAEPEEGLKSYSTDLCRNIKLNYVKDTVYKKVNVRLYETDLGDQTNDEKEKCYCRNEDSCLKKGLFDLTKCMGVPIYATLPHFLHTDKIYMEQVDGLEPNETKHSLRVYFESMTATPILAAKRMQLNFDLQPTEKIKLFSNLPNALFPIFWLEESVNLEGELLEKIRTLFLVLFVVELMLYLSMAVALALIGVGVYFHRKNRKAVAITPIPKGKQVNVYDNEQSDIKTLTRRGAIDAKFGIDNHAMSGHEFDRYM